MDSWRIKNEDFQRKAGKYQAEINIDKAYSLSLQREPPADVKLPIAPKSQVTRARSSSVPRGGGAVVSNRMSLDTAPIGNVKLSAIDPIQDLGGGGGAVARAPSKAQELGIALSGVQFSDATSSSLLGLDVSKEEQKIKQLQKDLVADVAAAAAPKKKGKSKK